MMQVNSSHQCFHLWIPVATSVHQFQNVNMEVDLFDDHLTNTKQVLKQAVSYKQICPLFQEVYQSPRFLRWDNRSDNFRGDDLW